MIFKAVKITTKTEELYSDIAESVDGGNCVDVYFCDPNKPDIYLMFSSTEEFERIMSFLNDFDEMMFTVTVDVTMSITYGVSGGNIDHEPEEDEFDILDKGFKSLGAHQSKNEAFNALDKYTEDYPEYNAFVVSVSFSTIEDESKITHIYTEAVACLYNQNKRKD